MSDKPFSHINIQLATPAGDDHFTREYVDSLMSTKRDLEHFGATFNWRVFPNCSDLCHVRNKILGKFVRTPEATHLLKIDSDMAWNSSDVIRMLSLDEDFIAGVGPKKKFPIEYCCSNRSDTTGIQQPVEFFAKGDTQLASLNYVGAGFVLITKACAVKMTEAYQDLRYTDVYDGDKEVGVYDPVYLRDGDYNERYFDDFAFCYRWRRIGGKVVIVPDITLKHTGNYTFEGTWKDSFQHG